MVRGKNRIPYWIDWRLTGLAEPDYGATISFGLPIEPEDSQYGKYRVIPFVQTQVLGFLLGGLWSFDHNGVQGRLQQLGIVHVCSRNHNAQGAALSIHKETALGTSLATVRRVGPNQVPPKRALPMAPSAACHSQSTPSNSSHPSTRAPHIRCKTPVPTHR